MRILVYVESVETLVEFLEKKSENVLWSKVPYLDFAQVSLDYAEYESLLKNSEPKEEVVEETIEEDNVSFWNMSDEELKEFNKRGLFSLEQMQSSFAAGTEYVINLKLEIEEEIHKKPKTFVEWYGENIKQQ